MQLTASSALRTPAAIRVYQSCSRVRTIRFEEEIPEEKKILELEIKIDEAGNDRELGDSLREQLKRTYDSWIERLDREIIDADSEIDQDWLEQQRERAISNYKPEPNP